ncbi:methyl-accepting chemotaxis protein [Geoalkalibacter sp.]|uniref:methyl-accepting chemotaxis protein n=1 Tax=Geoalkalibacter sp. TaxID=3041440 RepID=UPI00272E623D|nr:methyl-accepting chemotaxis protein [Geoalkalibacter sp.]
MKVSSFKNWKILNKILSISIVTLVSLSAGILFYLLPLIEERLMDEKMEAVGNVVSAASSLVQDYQARVQAGALSLEEAQAAALRQIRPMRYAGNEYLWVNTLDPIMVMHPIRPELDGTRLDDIKDPTGKAIFIEFAKVARDQGTGFVDYQWPKPGSTVPEPKLSQVNLIREWDWVIGSGIYVDDVEAQMALLRRNVIGATIIFSALIAVFAWVVARRIKDALNEAISASQQIASGDLTRVIEVKSADETGQLLKALRDMNEGLVRIVGEVRTGADSIASATEQISAGNADLSQRTEEQASSLEETASSMEELTSTVKQNAENAQQANQLAVSASEVAARGGEVIGRVVETMESITESSRRIADIIGVIDGIAFQTNILALNAAVEAARAGEQGRGFAVVAGEVRSLAQRSAGAAKEIKALIQDSTDKVEGGSRLVMEAGETTREIVTSIKRVTDLMGEISAASAEQSSGIEQVNTAITQMDDVTQQNAALVEEAAAAAEALAEQAQSMVAVVSRFKLTEETAPPARAKERKEAAPALAAKALAAKSRPATRPSFKAGAKKAAPAALETSALAAVADDEDWKEF